jgi:hypothetical protein
MKLIFGSTAVKHFFPDFNRAAKDLDYISPNKEKSSKEIEYHWVDSFQYIFENNKDTEYVDPDFLYTIKVSHAGWDIRWEKTMKDIEFLQSKNCKLDVKLYTMLLDEWDKIHYSKKNIILKGTSEEFFNKNILRLMKHDDLHEIVKFNDRPVNELVRPDLNDVKFDKNLWNALDHTTKIQCALEEIYVFALERHINFPPKVAFFKAAKQLITKSTRGYFNLFLIENFSEIMYYDKTDYIKKFKEYRNQI